MKSNLREVMRVSEWGVIAGAAHGESLSSEELGLYRQACAAIGERLGIGRVLMTATSDEQRALFVVERDSDAVVLEGDAAPDRLGDRLELIDAWTTEERAS